MPKRLKKELDENVTAFDVVRRATGQGPEPSSADISRVMAALGRRGGHVGGKRRLETLTAERRSEIALQAARTRWGHRKKKA